MYRQRTMHLFGGVGGGILGDILLGHQPVCAVEIDPYRQQVLSARQKDGCIPWFPIFDDIREFDGKRWRGLIDIIAAGPPCQPFSIAGKQLGEADPRNMWPDTIRVIREVGARFVMLENVTEILIHRYADTIFGDLAASGYCVSWDCLPASAFGADHKRDRLWIVADSNKTGWPGILCDDVQRGPQAYSRKGPPKALESIWGRLMRMEEELGEPPVFGTDDGIPHRVDRLAGIGDAQVPAVAKAAWLLLSGAET